MDAQSLSAREVMNAHPNPLIEGPLGKDIALQFLSGWFSGWPVVDDRRRVIGMVTDWNVLSAVFAGYDLAKIGVEHMMTTPPVVVREDDALGDVLQRMVREKLFKVSVVDADQRLVGIITRAELVQAMLDPPDASTKMHPACSWCGRIRVTAESSQRPVEEASQAGDQELRWTTFQPQRASLQAVRTPLAFTPTYCPQCWTCLKSLSDKWAEECSTSQTPSGELPRVLVVDDDPMVRRFVTEVLEQWGFHVTSATHGAEGLAALAHQRIDGVLLDLHMPVMDGPSMLDELRWRGFRMPVVVMSGEADHRRLRAFLSEGAQGFVVKPFDLHHLKSICRELFCASRETPSRVA